MVDATHENKNNETTHGPVHLLQLNLMTFYLCYK